MTRKSRKVTRKAIKVRKNARKHARKSRKLTRKNVSRTKRKMNKRVINKNLYHGGMFKAINSGLSVLPDLGIESGIRRINRNLYGQDSVPGRIPIGLSSSSSEGSSCSSPSAAGSSPSTPSPSSAGPHRKGMQSRQCLESEEIPNYIPGYKYVYDVLDPDDRAVREILIKAQKQKRAGEITEINKKFLEKINPQPGNKLSSDPAIDQYFEELNDLDKLNMSFEKAGYDDGDEPKKYYVKPATKKEEKAAKKAQKAVEKAEKEQKAAEKLAEKAAAKTQRAVDNAAAVSAGSYSVGST